MRPVWFRSTVRLAVAAILLVTIGLAIRGAAQQIATPTFRAGADYVRVDVYPTANGAPVDDLTKDDFQILEDGVPQQIDAFEHVSVRANRALPAQPDPSTLASQRAALENGRARVFVIYLDTYHVSSLGSMNVRRSLAQSLDRLISPDDLVAVMTPDMSARDLTFSHRPDSIERLLADNPDWGQRGQVIQAGGADETEARYIVCYPGGHVGGQSDCDGSDIGIADEMIARRREQRTLDSLSDVMVTLGDAREERKALLLLSEGWVLYGPSPALERTVACSVPGTPSVGVDPRTGGLRAGVADRGQLPGGASCDADRMRLAQVDHQFDFQRLTQQANRANVTFYPIDPRGLPVFDTPIDQQHIGIAPPGQPTLPPVSRDAANLRNRLDTLRVLATNTDGLAILNTNDLAGGLRRVETDLSSYYLLAYHSTGKLDSKFHGIRVRVTRPGVQVRARPGFLAVPPPAVQTRSAANTAALSSGAVAASTALSVLSNIARDAPLRLRPAIESHADGTLSLWIDGELQASTWPRGGTVQLTILDADGRTTTASPDPLVAGTRSFRQKIDLKPEVQTVTVRARATTAGGDVTLTDVVEVEVTSAKHAALVSRRGPATANRQMPTTDLRFRRNEQIRIDVPRSAATFSGRLLDRAGGVLAIPVTVAERTDADGTRWVSGSVTLAPLAPGDYVVDLTGAGGDSSDAASHVAVPFRIIP